MKYVKQWLGHNLPLWLQPYVFNVLRPVYRFVKKNVVYKVLCREISTDKILFGSENHLDLVQFGYLMGDDLLPALPMNESPHKKFLEQYDKIGEAIFEHDIFRQTPYYKFAYNCIRYTGTWHSDDTNAIINVAKKFIYSYQQKRQGILPPSSSMYVNVFKIKASSCYAIADGHHRVALATHFGIQKIKCQILPRMPVLTPLQYLLFNSTWLGGRWETYQPIKSPELEGTWTQVRACDDRLNAMTNFLKNQNFAASSPHPSYLDIACNLGYFVRSMQDKGYDAYGLERDKYTLDVAKLKFGLAPEKLFHSDIPLFLETHVGQYDVVSCMSILHHYINNPSKTLKDPVDIIKNIDRITRHVLFFETGEDHEKENAVRLKGWNPDYIAQWLKTHTSFKHIVPISIDQDNRGKYRHLYGRTFFACTR